MRTVKLLETLKGKTFHYLTVESVIRVQNPNKKHNNYLVCRCVCGNKIHVRYTDLKKEHTKSCGCKNRKHHWYFIKNDKRYPCKSVLEVLYAKHLIRIGIEFDFKPKTIRLVNGKLYTPSFHLLKENKYVEVRLENVYKHDNTITWLDIRKMYNFNFDHFQSLLYRLKKKNRKIEHVLMRDY